MNRLPVIGLIGAIGAGKTTAGQCLAARGAAIVDCDKLGHEALTDPAVLAKLVARWGEVVCDSAGGANRKAIASIVFDKPHERQWLESVVFPVIGILAEHRIEEATREAAAFVVLDAAVLLEAGWAARCDRILYIDAPREVREARVSARSQWTPADLKAREAAQWPSERKKQSADAVIVNDGTEAELQAKIDRMLTEWHLLPGPRT